MNRIYKRRGIRGWIKIPGCVDHSILGFAEFCRRPAQVYVCTALLVLVAICLKIKITLRLMVYALW